MRQGSRFGLRSPPPTQHLKRILSNYPEGSQVFKEALQNADDADASSFKVMIDQRRNRQCPAELERYSGPALYLYNDGIFQEQDWMSLQNMFESEKSARPSKIGRFGMGSRSFFHVTNLLCVASARSFAFMDPDETISDCGGGFYDFTKESDELLDCLVRPYSSVFGFNKDEQFCGTLFRLPLRLGKWARESTFAPYEYTVSQVVNHLEKFQSEAVNCLQFLQSVKSIEIWSWGEYDDAPRLLFSCDAHPRSKCVINQRKLLKEWLGSYPDSQSLTKFLRTCDARMLPKVEEQVTVTSKYYCPMEGTMTHQTVESWRVFIRVVGDEKLAELSADTHSAPIIGVSLRETPSFDGEALDGKMFNYLPISDVNLGLPGHVHGTFQMADNRRTIWLAANDAEGQALRWSQWNSILLKSWLARTYSKVLRNVDDITYLSWPDPDKVQLPELRDTLKLLAEDIVERPVVFKDDGSKIRPFDCTFVVPTAMELDCFGSYCEEVAKAAQNIGRDVVILPEHAQRLLQLAGMKFEKSLMDVFFEGLLPHWLSKHPSVIPFIPNLSAFMLRVCRTLAAGPEYEVHRFRRVCADLPFIPIKFPNVVYGPDENVPLRPPCQVYDPELKNFKVAGAAQPFGEFRRPEVLRVLRVWGLRQELTWGDIAHEAVLKMCAADACKVD